MGHCRWHGRPQPRRSRQSGNLDDIIERLRKANDVCREATDGQMMGSTVAVLHIHQDKAYVVWAGDSRIYRLRGDEFSQLTDDHSLVQELHRLGELTASEAENHPSQNVITRAIGVNDELDVQVRQVELEAGDRFLLCSDGLFKDVKPSVELALRRGGTDNVTAIVVQVAAA